MLNQLIGNLSIKIVTGSGELEPRLRFGCLRLRIGQFTNECRFITPFPPRFSKIRTYAP